ncbi:protein ENHANCED PSEUDOMONAS SUSCEPTIBILITY 1-like [Miscanthus floridulus]|uniref:protein ENHANCED PSEUDOMONAS SUSCEPTIBILITY 1-like n=1 Tax=Miscanthus floridulus TaxID=154761 RepID=UPI0034595AEE
MSRSPPPSAATDATSTSDATSTRQVAAACMCALIQSLFPLVSAVNHDGHHLPMFVVQVTELTDGVILGFAYNHALSDGTVLWRFINVWAGIVHDSLSASPSALGPEEHKHAPAPPPLLEHWSPDGLTTLMPPVVLPFPDLTGRIERLPSPPLCERMLQFSAHTLEALKDRAWEELLAAEDTAGAAAVTKFQALSSLVWHCVTPAHRLSPDQTTFCRATINNRTRLRPQGAAAAGWRGCRATSATSRVGRRAAPPPPLRGLARAPAREPARHHDCAAAWLRTGKKLVGSWAWPNCTRE